MKPQPGGRIHAIKRELHPFAPSTFKGTPAEGVVVAPEKQVWIEEDWCQNIIGVWCDEAPHPVGSRIWVKETWRTVNDPATCIGDALEIDYRADGITRIMDKVGKSRWRPSIHMPRWASRINLEVTEVRVERLQEITNEDALEEGIVDWCPYDRCGGIGYLPQNHTVTEPEVCECSHFDGVEVYKLLWESINGPGSWDQNPWVFVYTFRRVK